MDDDKPTPPVREHTSSADLGPQLSLPLPLSRHLELDDLAQGEHNAKAMALIAGWPDDWPLPWAALWGPAASGKSVMADIWAARADAQILQVGDIAGAGLRNSVLDLDTSAGLPTAQEVPLFHLMNNLRAGGFSLLIVARYAPARWAVDLPDLASRLRAVLAVEIGEGDQDFLEMLLVALAAQLELDMRPEARAYLAQRLPRSAAACLSLMRILAARTRVVTVPQARAALDEWQTLDHQSTR